MKKRPGNTKEAVPSVEMTSMPAERLEKFKRNAEGFNKLVAAGLIEKEVVDMVHELSNTSLNARHHVREIAERRRKKLG